MLTSNIENVQSRVGRYVSVFNDLSRLNHSCSPNTHWKFHMSTFSVQLRAARDIEEGETIFTDILRPAAERAKSVAPDGIECTCRACLDPANSDPVRAAVKNRPDVYSPKTQRRDSPPDAAWIDPAVQTLARMEQDGLHTSAAFVAG
ncbi:uncharacterized protein BT62DRAFT_66300 [Guyanagaster necrorhizus]|uniref:SET domain-containing protein n=1 Tax=Guyanagaster necrorhizus TaxID=856835 RepID=A0A9P8AT86_9AGAR|nr:uncharacterized protein BT62DRAFT_66300 [Guyanagaster necrorhizus MCA 3950]KAG7447183.1 hypothetical protein BT62DRAFT_66300 [Guyanagaster necrorhizus MCA 3950]